jgi:Protein of unknown function (DUF2786)
MTESTTPDNIEAVKRRIAKLLAIAEDNRADPNEAAAAAGQAEKIMRKFQLEHADLITVELRKGEAMETADSVANAKTNKTAAKEVPPWASFLAVEVGRFNHCGARIARTQDERAEVCVRFFGYAADVQLCKWMYDYLVATINRLAEEYKWSDDYRLNGRSVLTSYRRGVASGINSAIKKLREERDRQTTTTGTSLMVVKKDAIVAKFGNVFAVKQANRSTVRGEAFSAGYEDGRKVDVGRRSIGAGGTNMAARRIGN